MGLFDDVRCEMPLPDGYDPDRKRTFQTKDLGCDMGDYRITGDGRLIRESEGYFPNEKLGETDFHGWLNFYDWVSETSEWHEYNAKFTDGKCVEITTVDS